jgi:hypothetical protein
MVENELKARIVVRQRLQMLVDLVLLAAFVGLVYLAAIPKSAVWFGEIADIVAVFAVIGVALVFTFENWRCPACDGLLGASIRPRTCGDCGAELA